MGHNAPPRSPLPLCSGSRDFKRVPSHKHCPSYMTLLFCGRQCRVKALKSKAEWSTQPIQWISDGRLYP